MLLATVMVVGCFTGCGSDKKNDSSEVVSTEQSGSKEETPELDMSETVKMGILVSDATSAEALAFRTYYTEYIQKQYNVELLQIIVKQLFHSHPLTVQHRLNSVKQQVCIMQLQQEL